MQDRKRIQVLDPSELIPRRQYDAFSSNCLVLLQTLFSIVLNVYTGDYTSTRSCENQNMFEGACNPSWISHFLGVLLCIGFPDGGDSLE